MQFTIVIPTYNRAHLLARTLESVWGQRFPDYEVIVVDDGSNDGTQKYLQEVSNKIRLITQANRGPGAARNAGVREARGEYVALLDSDDLWFPWTLDTFARAIQKHGNPHILGGNFVEFTDEAELRAVREESHEAAWFSDYISSSHHAYIVGSGTCVLRRKSFAGAKFLEDRLNAEDHDLILQLGTLPGFVQILAPVTLAWRRHAESETGNFDSSLLGTKRLVEREKSSAYPGGRKRSLERRRILTLYTRSITLGCLQQGDQREAWMLYRATFAWNGRLGRVRYLSAFPFLAVAEKFRRKRRITRYDHH
jgi:glycosyltransferase involved in cell wall biosynthesis